MRTKQLVFERTYNAPLKKVWKALTDEKQMKQWYFDVSAFKPEPGFEFTFYGEKDGVRFLHLCRVMEAIPMTKISYTWSYEKYTGESLVTFELDAISASKTKLTLTHSGLDNFPENEPDLAAGNFAEGWKAITSTMLTEFVETDFISKNATINATAGAVWKVLLAPNGNWANAFGDGSYAKTDWKQGSAIVWTDPNGSIGARGFIDNLDENNKLVLSYFDDVDPSPGEEPGEYKEIFTIEKASDSSVKLTAVSGPLSKKYVKPHSEMWEKAVNVIKSLAEEQR